MSVKLYNNDIDCFNIHDRNILSFVFAESGYVQYKMTRNYTPYILQYEVLVRGMCLYVPLTWGAFDINNFALPQYVESIYEWDRDGKSVERLPLWRPSSEYIHRLYWEIGGKLYDPEPTVEVMPISRNIDNKIAYYMPWGSEDINRYFAFERSMIA